MKNYVDNNDIPLGLSSALAKDIVAMNYFSSLSPNKQREIIKGTHNISSKQEMHQYVNSITKNF